MKNILCIRADRLGEFLLNLPAIQLLKENYPESKIFLLAQKANLDLIKGVFFVDQLIEYTDRQFKGFFGAVRLALLIRKFKIDSVVCLHPRRDFHLASFLSGASVRLGYKRKWGFCLTHTIEDLKAEGKKHEVFYNLDLVNSFCQQVFVPEVNISLKELQGDFSKCVVLHPFSSNPDKKIGEAFWVSCIKFFQDQGEKVVFIGTKEERWQFPKLLDYPGTASYLGQFNLAQLASFLANNCRLFIGLDSGPMHLAAMLKVPVVGLFTRSNSKRWGPFSESALVIEEKDKDNFIKRLEIIKEFYERIGE